MDSLQKALEHFLKMGLRERLLVVTAIALVMYFIIDLTLLKPQQRDIQHLKKLDESHQSELTMVNNALADIEKNMPEGVSSPTMSRASLDEIKKQIAEADALFGEVDASTSQTGILVKKILAANPSLTLMSLNTMPTTPFYTIESKAGTANAPPAAPKTIYSYGVEVSIKGNYLALLSYMENLRKYPKRLFWSNAYLDVDRYPDAVLKLAVYSLSAQPNSPLR